MGPPHRPRDRRCAGRGSALQEGAVSSLVSMYWTVRPSLRRAREPWSCPSTTLTSEAASNTVPSASNTSSGRGNVTVVSGDPVSIPAAAAMRIPTTVTSSPSASASVDHAVELRCRRRQLGERATDRGCRFARGLPHPVGSELRLECVSARHDPLGDQEQRSANGWRLVFLVRGWCASMTSAISARPGIAAAAPCRSNMGLRSTIRRLLQGTFGLWR